MLRKETVEPATLELLRGLMQDDRLNNFTLVGGTALALQIGHRKSIDLDLFTQTSFDESDLSGYLEASRSFQLDFMSKNTLKGEITGTKVDFITHAYPLVKPPVTVEGVRLAGIEDIMAMKLNAIIGNGSRLKDFVDVAYCSSVISLHQMVQAYEKKYQSRNAVMAIKALAWHKDINQNEPIQLLSGTLQWPAVEKRLTEMIRSSFKVFPEVSMEVKKEKRQRPKL